MLPAESMQLGCVGTEKAKYLRPATCLLAPGTYLSLIIGILIMQQSINHHECHVIFQKICAGQAPAPVKSAPVKQKKVSPQCTGRDCTGQAGQALRQTVYLFLLATCQEKRCHRLRRGGHVGDEPSNYKGMGSDPAKHQMSSRDRQPFRRASLTRD